MQLTWVATQTSKFPTPVTALFILYFVVRVSVCCNVRANVLQYSHLVDQQAAPFSVQFPVQFCSIRGRLHGEFHPKLSFSLLHRAEIV